jgi:hypothetical protein
MKHGTIYEQQIDILTMLPFWTTTYFFYLNEKYTGENRTVKPNEKRTIESAKPKVSVPRKVNDIRNNGKGRGGRVSRWGDKDEVQLSKSNSPQSGNGVLMSKMHKSTRNVMGDSGRENNEVALKEGGTNEMTVWEARERSEMREEIKNMKSLIEDNKKEMKALIEDNNKVNEEKMNDNKSEILNQMKEDKNEFKGALDKMMEIMSGLVKKNLL